MAQLTFLGATDRVTGSCYQIQTQRATVLLECGLIQGRRQEEEAAAERPYPDCRLPGAGHARACLG